MLFILSEPQGFVYFLDHENFAEWAVYVNTMVFIVPFLCDDAQNHYQWGAGAIAIFIAWINLLMYQQRYEYDYLFVLVFESLK